MVIGTRIIKQTPSFDQSVNRRESLMNELKPLMNPDNPQQTLVSVVEKALGGDDATKLFASLKNFTMYTETSRNYSPT